MWGMISLSGGTCCICCNTNDVLPPSRFIVDGCCSGDAGQICCDGWIQLHVCLRSGAFPDSAPEHCNRVVQHTFKSGEHYCTFFVQAQWEHCSLTVIITILMNFLKKALKIPFCFTAVYFQYLPYIILGTLSIASSLTAFFLPETFQVPLPQTIEEMAKTNRWVAAGILSRIACVKVCEHVLVLFFGAFQLRPLGV